VPSQSIRNYEIYFILYCIFCISNKYIYSFLFYFILPCTGFVFGLFRNKSVCFGCFETDPKHRNKPKKYFWVSRNKPKINRNRFCFGLFWCEPKKICLFRGHPTSRVIPFRENFRESSKFKKQEVDTFFFFFCPI
jgi:hypothetical protein